MNHPLDAGPDAFRRDTPIPLPPARPITPREPIELLPGVRIYQSLAVPAGMAVVAVDVGVDEHGEDILHLALVRGVGTDR